MKIDEEHGSLFFFWKSRVGLYLILKAIGVGPGDEVILPGFTCVVVANAVIYCGATPVYADIDSKTYNITPESVAPLINSKTRVLIVQNTFGLSPDYDPLMALAEKQGLFVIEDCAHGQGSTYKGRPAGTNTHAAFFSSQWSKPISTGLGGVLVVRDTELKKKMDELYHEVPKPSWFAQLFLLAQVLVRPLADQPALHYGLLDVYRYLTQKAGISIGSSVGDELSTTSMPDGYLKKMGFFQRLGWNQGLKKIERLVSRRRQVADFYNDFFARKGIAVPLQPDYARHGMLRYVIRVADKETILRLARKHHIPIGDWFMSPLHPVEDCFEKWHYQTGQCPEAERACRETVNLFTDRALSKKQLDILFS